MGWGVSGLPRALGPSFVGPGEVGAVSGAACDRCWDWFEGGGVDAVQVQGPRTLQEGQEAVRACHAGCASKLHAGGRSACMPCARHKTLCRRSVSETGRAMSCGPGLAAMTVSMRRPGGCKQGGARLMQHSIACGANASSAAFFAICWACGASVLASPPGHPSCRGSMRALRAHRAAGHAL